MRNINWKVEKVEPTSLKAKIEEVEMNKKEKDKLMEIMNKIQNKDKIINAISSKVNKQIFFIL